jgi:hypothetical protein
MEKENSVHIYNRVLLSHGEEWDYVICRKTDGTGDHQVKQKKLE